MKFAFQMASQSVTYFCWAQHCDQHTDTQSSAGDRR